MVLSLWMLPKPLVSAISIAFTVLMHLLQCTDQYRCFIHFSIVLDLFHLYVYEQFSCVYLCAPCASLMPVEIRRELWIPRTVLWMVMSHDVSAKSRTSSPTILLLWDSPLNATLHFVTMSLLAPLSYSSFLDCLCFGTWQSWRVKCCVGYSSIWISPMFVS